MSRRSILLMMIAVFSVLCVFTACSSKDDSKQDNQVESEAEKYERAVDYYNKGNYNSALIIFSELEDYKDSDEYEKLCRDSLITGNKDSKDQDKTDEEMTLSLEYVFDRLLLMEELSPSVVTKLEARKDEEQAVKLLELYNAEQDNDLKRMVELIDSLCQNDEERFRAVGALWEGYYHNNIYNESGSNLEAEMDIDQAWEFIYEILPLCSSLNGNMEALINGSSSDYQIYLTQEALERIGTEPNGKVLIVKDGSISIQSMAYLDIDSVPASLEEVQYEIVIETGYTVPFKYDNGVEAKQLYTDVYLMTYPQNEIIYKCDRINGGQPSAVVMADIDQKEAHGYGTDCDPNDVAEKIKECIDRSK